MPPFSESTRKVMFAIGTGASISLLCEIVYAHLANRSILLTILVVLATCLPLVQPLERRLVVGSSRKSHDEEKHEETDSHFEKRVDLGSHHHDHTTARRLHRVSPDEEGVHLHYHSSSTSDKRENGTHEEKLHGALSSTSSSSSTPLSSATATPDEPDVTNAEARLWGEAIRKLSPEQRRYLTYDLKVRHLRGSAYIAHHAKRLKYLEKRLSDTVKFHAEMSPSTILQRWAKDFPDYRAWRDECWPMRIYGNDKDGNPIVGVALGSCDWSAAKRAPYKPRILEYLALHQEALMRLVRERSTNTTRYKSEKNRVQPQYCLIFDVAHLSFAAVRAGYSLGLGDFAALWGVNYPETLCKCYVVNAPAIVDAAWRLVSPFVEPDTLLKIRILKGEEQYMKEFRNDGISLDSLPTSLGGRNPGVFVLSEEQRGRGE